MFLKLFDLLKLKHYRHGKWLKFFSAIQLLFTFVLLFLPFYFFNVVDLLATVKKINIPIGTSECLPILNLTSSFFSWMIAALSALNLIKEYLLSRAQVIGFDYKREQIKQLLTFLMDNYKWKGSCRATFFVPDHNSEKIEIYERISAGRGPGGFAGNKCYFKMGQGIPGRAWSTAWAGDEGNDFSALIKSIQIGIVPEKVLNKTDELRFFFKDHFGITDNKIYDALGNAKSEIRAYMAVGILGRYHALIGVLVIDSDDPNKFTDFEQLKNTSSGGTLTQEAGMTIFGEDEPDFCDLPVEIKNLPQEIKEFRKQVPMTQKLTETKEKLQKFSIIMHAMQSKKVSLHAPAFIFPLSWVLKQMRDIFLMDSE